MARRRLLELREKLGQQLERVGNDEWREDLHRMIAEGEHQLDKQLAQLRNEWREQRERAGREEGQHHPEHHPKHNPAMERIERMHIAAEHLDAAGLHEIAGQVRSRAEEMERDLHPHPHPPHEPELHDAVNQLQEQLHDLRREVAELKERLNDMRRDRD